MPDVVGAAYVIEEARKEAFGRLARIQQCTGNVHEQTLSDGRVEVLCPCDATGIRELAGARPCPLD